MKMKRTMLVLTLLMCAQEASAGWWSDMTTWFVSKLPESWQGRACAAGVATACALGGTYLYRQRQQRLAAEAVRKADRKHEALARYADQIAFGMKKSNDKNSYGDYIKLLLNDLKRLDDALLQSSISKLSDKELMVTYKYIDMGFEAEDPHWSHQENKKVADAIAAELHKRGFKIASASN